MLEQIGGLESGLIILKKTRRIESVSDGPPNFYKEDKMYRYEPLCEPSEETRKRLRKINRPKQKSARKERKLQRKLKREKQ